MVEAGKSQALLTGSVNTNDSRSAMQVDHAETANIEKLISRIGAGLDQFLKFEHALAIPGGGH